MVYVLIEAGEGDIETVVVGYSKDDLKAALDLEHEEYVHIKTSDWPTFTKINQDYALHELNTVKAMLENHDNWNPGRYILKNIDPIWQEWTLFIKADKGA